MSRYYVHDYIYDKMEKLSRITKQVKSENIKIRI